MASSRLYHHLSSSFLLIQRRRNSLLSSSHPLSLRLLPASVLRPLSVTPPLPRLRFYSGSSAVSAEEEAAAPPHPWPEWDQFVEKMKSKGYFEKTSENAEEGGGVGAIDESAASSMDLNRVKNACLKFARERFDILRSLPKEDIQTVVECGCPNLFRKAVNSAKRLRAFLRLDEGDVCGACNLRGSCDRAYVIAKEDEGARTVDIMRILMSYAVDPVLHSGGKNLSVKEHVQESARKLLAELIKLSDTTIDVALPIPAVNPPSQKKEPTRKVISMNKQSPNVEMKRGDWLCPNCNFLNFARNVRCLECKEDGPKRVNFSGAEMKLGDWTCPKCEFMNFARNKKCFRCYESRPKRELNPGEWECPSCDFLNFRRNEVCKKCNCERPDSDEGSRFEDHVWKKPRQAKENKGLKFGDDDDEEDDDNDDDDDDILPLQEGENKFVVSKRATPAERRLTSARMRNHPR